MMGMANVATPDGLWGTFHEALQFAWLTHKTIEAEVEAVRSMRHFDRASRPYYKVDLDVRTPTFRQARDLTCVTLDVRERLDTSDAFYRLPLLPDQFIARNARSE